MSGDKLSPRGRLVAGLLCILCGVMPMLVALGIGPFVNGRAPGVPDWIPIAGGLVFLFAGLSLMCQPRPVFAALLGFGAVVALAAVGNWVAFGPGTRSCTATLSGWWSNSRAVGDLTCRIAFGWGAVLMDIFVLLLALSAASKTLGGPLVRLRRGVEWMLLAVLSPLLLVLAVFALVGGGREALTGWVSRRFGQIKKDSGDSR